MAKDGPLPSETRAISLYLSEQRPCPYLPDRIAQDIFLRTESLDPAAYESFMNAGFRRSSTVVYRPNCDHCSECRPIRVPVQHFHPSRSQRRALRRNADVEVSIQPPQPSDEKWRLYSRYLKMQHDDAMSGDRDSFERFLYQSPTATLEMTYRVAGRIVGVGILDETPNCLSSVYFYYEPDAAKRSLGIYSSLIEIETCRSRNLPWWYAGFYVKDCRKMTYKAQFRPHELLGPDLAWHAADNSQEIDTPP